MSDQMTEQNWKTIDDAKKRHIWRNRAGDEIAVDLGFYQENGTPHDAEECEDYIHVRTEIDMTA